MIYNAEGIIPQQSPVCTPSHRLPRQLLPK
jgi:hypothetical protein